MSQKNQGNKQSTKQGADRGHPGNTKTVSGIEKVGGKSGVRFPVPNHPEKCHVETPERGGHDRDDY